MLAHAAEYPAGTAERYSRYYHSKVTFNIWSKKDVEKAARRLWKVTETAPLLVGIAIDRAMQDVRNRLGAALDAEGLQVWKVPAEKELFEIIGRAGLDEPEESLGPAIEGIVATFRRKKGAKKASKSA
jgi:hypothetical protein